MTLDDHKIDKKTLTTTMKIFSVLGLKPQALEKEKENVKKDKKKKDSSVRKTNTEKEKSKLPGEGKKKKRRERSLSPTPQERRTSKRRVMKLVEESSSLLGAEDEVFAISVEPINLVELVVQAVTRAV